MLRAFGVSGSDKNFEYLGEFEEDFRKCWLYCVLYLLVIERCKNKLKNRPWKSRACVPLRLHHNQAISDCSGRLKARRCLQQENIHAALLSNLFVPEEEKHVLFYITGWAQKRCPDNSPNRNSLMTTCPMTTRPMDSSPHGHLAPWTPWPQNSSPHGHLAPWTPFPMDCSPHRQLPSWTACPMNN